MIATGSTLADISIRNHVFAWILMSALILFGIIANEMMDGGKNGQRI